MEASDKEDFGSEASESCGGRDEASGARLGADEMENGARLDGEMLGGGRGEIDGEKCVVKGGGRDEASGARLGADEAASGARLGGEKGGERCGKKGGTEEERKFRKLFDSEMGRMDEEEFKRAEKLPVAVVLDNVRSANNVGSAFRSCDAFRMEKMVLCGITGCPPAADIHKTALGAEFSMEWEYCKSTVEAVRKMKEEGRCIVTVEQAEHSTALQEMRLERGRSYAFVFGNEVEGVQQEVMDLADACIEIPQYGTKHSLNVSVSVGIVLWEAARELNEGKGE